MASDQDSTPRWLKILAKVVGVIVAIAMFVSGIVTCISIHPLCIGAGIIMLAIAFLIMLFEAPICCMYFEKTKSLSAWLEERAYWQKALIYLIVTIIAIAMCQSLSAIIGCLFGFGLAALNGFLWLRQRRSGNEAPSHTAGGTDFDNLGG